MPTPGPQFKQLPMFMTAHELRHGTVAQDAEAYEHPDIMWRDKTRRAQRTDYHGWGRIRDVESGVREPVKVDHRYPDDVEHPPVLFDGHHRVAAAYSHNPQALVPVEHSAQWRLRSVPREHEGLAG